jgi:hypothetical protein
LPLELPRRPYILGNPHAVFIARIPFLFFQLDHLAGASPDRRRVPEFDNRIWLPFAERAAPRMVDMQMIAVQPPKGLHREGCHEEGNDRRESAIGDSRQRSSVDTWGRIAERSMTRAKRRNIRPRFGSLTVLE